MAAAFLNQLLTALNASSFPRLENINFEGFHILESAIPREAAAAQLSKTFQLIQDCPYNKGSFTEVQSLDYRCAGLGVFEGHDSANPNLNGFIDILERS